MQTIRLPREIREFAEVFRAAGKSCYIVGGAVRDALLGSASSDFDAATDALPEEVIRLFRRVVPTGLKHGTVTVLWKGQSIETTTFRREIGYSDGRRPDRVEFGATIEEDLERRDFTINAMAWDPLASRLVDPQGGRSDLAARIIRAVGDPAARFEEDGLRALRAVRFAARLGFALDPATKEAIPGALGKLALVSAERVRDEIAKTLLAPRPSVGLRLMEESGMLRLLLPELAACRGVEQKGMHRFDVLDHSLLAADAIPPRLALRLAALCHDLGKPEARAIGPDGMPSFHRHEEYGARITEALLKRLRFPNALVEEVLHLVRQHMFHYEESWTDAAVRRFLARVGPEAVEPLLSLRLADTSATFGLPADPRGLMPFRERIEKVLEEGKALKLKDLAIGGAELASIGVPRGPVMGKILAELLETVLDDPAQNEAERLLGIARELKGKYGLG
jgi:tRNA nucleotidyltransferase/poly(A) polymerase